MGLVAHQSRTAERKIARLATRAHGVVTHRELRRAGVTVDEIRGRIDSGALIRVFPDATRHRGIPITTVPATLVRVPSLLSFDELARPAHQAAIRHHTTPEQIQAG
jgi:hypothetical protein